MRRRIVFLMRQGRLRGGPGRPPLHLAGANDRKRRCPGVSALGGARFAEVDQLDSELASDADRLLVPVELAEVDPLDAAVRDQLEAAPAGAGRGVDFRVLDPDAVLRGL